MPPLQDVYKYIDWIAGDVDKVESETDKKHYARKEFSIEDMDDEEKMKVSADSRERQTLAHPFIQSIR